MAVTEKHSTTIISRIFIIFIFMIFMISYFAEFCNVCMFDRQCVLRYRRPERDNNRMRRRQETAERSTY